MSKLTLGPLLFNWEASKRRDFYFRIADEADIDVVYLGEVICAKREPIHARYLDEIVKRLEKAKKQVIHSTSSLVMSNEDSLRVKDKACDGTLIEVNDVACVDAVSPHPFVIGPFINCFNEGALDFLRKKGAQRLVMPIEMSTSAQSTLAKYAGAMETEILAFGAQTLSISMRCYHARAVDRPKDECRFVCGNDAEGMAVDTLAEQPLFRVNGTSVMSRGFVVLLEQMAALQKAGVGYFRLSPQDVDMIGVAKIYRDCANQKQTASESVASLRAMMPDAPFINGYAHAREGRAWQ